MRNLRGLCFVLAALLVSAAANGASAADPSDSAEAAVGVPAPAQSQTQGGWLTRKNQNANPFRPPAAGGLRNYKPQIPSLHSEDEANVVAAPTTPVIPALRCDRGFRAQGQDCVPVEVPQNASLDANGHAWVCDRGFRRQAQQCLPVQLPEHAALDNTGHGWVCEQGFRRDGVRCIDAATPKGEAPPRAAAARPIPGITPQPTRPPVTINSQDTRRGRQSTAKVVIGRF